MWTTWWPMEGSMLGGLWKEKEKHLFHLFSFYPPANFISTFFSLILKFYFAMGLHYYFTPFFPFP
jgi:hypothetical protein